MKRRIVRKVFRQVGRQIQTGKPIAKKHQQILNRLKLQRRHTLHFWFLDSTIAMTRMVQAMQKLAPMITKVVEAFTQVSDAARTP